MFAVHVYVHVKPESVEAFKEATLENARNSLKEDPKLVQEIEAKIRQKQEEKKAAAAQPANKATQNGAQQPKKVMQKVA